MKYEARISNFFFYLLILLLPTQLGRHFFPNFSFVSGIRVDYLSPTIYVTDVLILILFVFWFIQNVKISKIKNQKSKIIELFGYWKFAVLVVFLIIGILLSKNQPVGWYGFVKLIELIFLGFYTADNFKKLSLGIVLFLFSIGVVFESLLAIVQYFNQGSAGGVLYFFGERSFNAQTPGIANASVNGVLFLRPYATFPHPNVLAGFLVIAMTMIIMNYESRIRNYAKILFSFSLILGTFGLLLTMSRIAILIWLITLCIFLFRKFLNHKSYILILLGVLLVLGIATPLGARFTQLKLTDESITKRGELMRSSVEMVKSNPLFGVGLNNFLVELSNYKIIKNYFTDLQPVHNIYLLILSQTGIVGFIFFLWFIGKTYKVISNQQLAIRNKKEFVIHNSKFIILSIVLVLGLFDHYFLTLQQGQLLFSFVLGICWNNKKNNSF